MKYMLDTNICIYIIKKKPHEILQQFENIHIGDICVSSITLAELTDGVEKSQSVNKNLMALEEFILPLEIAPFDAEAAFCYGKIRATLEKSGTPIGSMDLLIAAHAQSLKCVLITNNKKEFSRVPKLKVATWI